MVVVGGRLCCCFFSCSSVLLVGVCLLGLHASAYVEASSCQRVIHKKVGDTVELPSCSPSEGVSAAVWRYGESRIADKDYNISGKQFQGRLFLNPTNFSLTLRELMASDSGNFSFISTDKDGKQREIFTVTLHVHEPITERPVLKSSIPWNTLNKSCTVYLGCSTTTKGHVTYTWSVRNQTTSGSRLQYDIKPQDGETEFTCTISNHFSNMSASTKFKCEDPQPMTKSSVLFVIGLIVAVLLVVLLPLLLLCWIKKMKGNVCLQRKSQRANQSSAAFQTFSHGDQQHPVYSSLLHGDTSVYETTAGRGNTGEHAVYEQMDTEMLHLRFGSKVFDRTEDVEVQWRAVTTVS